MRKLLLLVLFCAPMLGSIPPVNKEIINPAPKRFYINNLDIIEYHDEFPQDIIDPLPIPINQEPNEELT